MALSAKYMLLLKKAVKHAVHCLSIVVFVHLMM